MASPPTSSVVIAALCRSAPIAVSLSRTIGVIVPSNATTAIFPNLPHSVCFACSSPALYPFGLGTQQVEEVLRALFPTARLARMDRDTTRAKAAHQRILRTLGSGDIDILVGTQMIAKGHDYPNITLVGVVSADATLAIPDFRAPERLFQLLTQVAGRAGRGQAHGHVFLQTYRPEHYSIAFAQHHDFTGFFHDEVQRRQAMLYPPYARLARLIVDSPDAVRAEAASRWPRRSAPTSYAPPPTLPPSWDQRRLL